MGSKYTVLSFDGQRSDDKLTFLVRQDKPGLKGEEKIMSP
jgi:hypothetical protein